MDRILYLVHTTIYDNYRKWDELTPSPIKDSEHQFPGVYFTLITKDNIKKENLYYTNNILIFSKKLLEQNNYHINIRDYNGFINEKNTYFPWNLDKAVKKIKTISKKNYDIGNEVIFHDPVPMKYLCSTISNISIDKSIMNKYNVSLTALFLPIYELYNYEPPDMSKLPFYCLPFEDKYTGIGKYNLSSKKFYKKMAILCNVDKNQPREKIIKDIIEKIEDLYYNRDKQKLEEFKQSFMKKPKIIT